MGSDIILFLILGGLAGGFINGFAGTGTALFAMGFMLSAVDPKPAVAIIALLSVLVGAQGLWMVRAEIGNRPKRLARFILPGLIGVPVGLILLEHVDPETLRTLIGALLIIYGGYFGFRKVLPRFERHVPVVDASVGFTGGILGGMAALSGAAPSIWLSMRPWTKVETRAVLQPYNISILLLIIVLLAIDGVYTAETLLAFAVTLPAGAIAAQAGIAAFKRCSDTQYRRLLIILSLGLGIGILIRQVIV